MAKEEKKPETTVIHGEEHMQTPIEYFMETRGVSEATARQAVADINAEARINQLEGRLAALQLEARAEKPKWKYFTSGGTDLLLGTITAKAGFDIEEFLTELWVFAQSHRFDIPGLHKLTVDCGIIAYLVLDKIEKLDASANNMVCSNACDFRVRRIR